jgi:hypothetical protein
MSSVAPSPRKRATIWGGCRSFEFAGAKPRHRSTPLVLYDQRTLRPSSPFLPYSGDSGDLYVFGRARVTYFRIDADTQQHHDS